MGAVEARRSIKRQNLRTALVQGLTSGPDKLLPIRVPKRSIAVLPFSNLSDDKRNTYFADGLQDEILSTLAKILKLKVISRTSVMTFRSGDDRSPAIPGLTESLTDLSPTEWRMILAKLRRAKLLAREDTHNPAQLDTHPLIREYFGEQLRTQQTHAWKECNRRLFHYYRTLAPQLPDSFRDMEPLFLAVICGCNAGLFRQALHEVYIPRIQRGDSCFAANFLGARGALPYPHSSASPLPLFGQTLGTVKAYHGKPSYTLSLTRRNCAVKNETPKN